LHIKPSRLHLARYLARFERQREHSWNSLIFFSSPVDLLRPTLGAPAGNEEKSVKKMASLTIALTLGCAGIAMAQEQALTQQEVGAQLTQQGYTDVHDLEFQDGIWTARARSGDGERVKLRVDPITGRAYPNKQVSMISEDDIRSSLSVQGYTNVHDMDFHHGIWTVRARNSAGVRVSLQIDGQSGRIIGAS
jgi:hypothetical protein